MQANRGRDTKPELAVRRLVHAQGLRYRVNVRPVNNLRRTADLVFTKQRVAVFLDGCFWHGCPDHFTLPSANRVFWDAKISGNVERDAETSRLLADQGWFVLRFWEHELPETVASRIVETVRDLPGRREPGA